MSRRSFLTSRRFGWGVLGVVAIVAMVLVAYFTPLMSVRTVDVGGNGGISREEILAVAGVAHGTPLLQVDVVEISERVAAIAPVESARVQRSYPSTITITVVERVPLVRTESDGAVSIVDRQGVAYLTFDEGAQIPPELAGLPLLDTANPGPRDPTTLAVVSVLEDLPEQISVMVRGVSAVSPVSIEFTLDGDRTVVWGDEENGAAKARTLEHLLSQKGSWYNVSSPEFPAFR